MSVGQAAQASSSPALDIELEVGRLPCSTQRDVAVWAEAPE